MFVFFTRGVSSESHLGLGTMLEFEITWYGTKKEHERFHLRREDTAFSDSPEYDIKVGSISLAESSLRRSLF